MAPKPRGLKGSKRAAPAFVPDDAETRPIASTNPERTVPLDEDSLTLPDIFELRLSSLKLLSPPSHSSSTPITEEGIEEGRSLLRGILHGLEGLLRILEDPSLSNETTEEGRTTHLTALGLTERSAKAKIYYLQAFALGEIGVNLPPPATASLGGSKRRKIDLREPKESKEWLDEAIDRIDLALKELGDEGGVVGWVARLDLIRFLVERARVAFGTESEIGEEEGQKLIVRLGEVLKALEKEEFPSLSDDELELFGPILLSVIRSLEMGLSTIERFPNPSSLESIGNVLRIVGKVKEDKTEAEFEILRSDALLAKFILEEEVVEDKYRPEEDGEEDEEEQDDADVKDLPDEEDVRATRQSGEDAIASLKATIILLSASSTASAESTKSKSSLTPLLQAQYKKLEEALLTFSAMIRKEESEKMDECEKMLEECRKDGGIEVEEE